MDLQEISDRFEIEGAIVRYTRAIDTGDWDALDTVFTPDAEIDYTESGGVADTYATVKPWLAELPDSENDGARKPFDTVARRATVLMGVYLTPIFGDRLPPKSE